MKPLHWCRKYLCILTTFCLLLGVVKLQAQSSSMPQFGHVFLLVLENNNYSSEVGSSHMPYLNSLISQAGLATSYYATTHPSIGNYFSMTTGEILDNNDNDTPYSFPISSDNIIRELIKAGKTWKDYAESIPSVGYVGGNSGNYYVRHNPIPYFTDVNCGTSACLVQAQKIVPFTQLATDIASNNLPDFGYIVPNACDDAHNCSLSTADNWLKANIAPLIASAAFQKNGLLIITSDENSNTGGSCSVSGSVSSNCGGQVATVVISPLLKSKGIKVSTFYNHFSLLRTLMQGLGLTTYPGISASATAMSAFFGTASTSNTPVASLSPASLSFGSVKTGSTSSAQTVTLKNTGSSTLTIGGISANGSFSETHNCASSLTTNARCTLSVSFSPQTTGTLSGTLAVSDNATGSPQSVSLTGSGTSSSASGSTGGSAAGSTTGGVTTTPTSLNFGTVKVNTTSAPQAVMLHNGTTSAISIYGIYPGWAYSETNNCGSVLAAGASCTIEVTLTPQYPDPIPTETLVVSAGGANHTVTLSGAGSNTATTFTSGTTATSSGSTSSGSTSGSSGGSSTGTSSPPDPSGLVSMLPTALNFGTVHVNSTSGVQAVILHNGTSSFAFLYGVYPGWAYSETNNCGSGLAAGASCTIDVRLTPQYPGPLPTETLAVAIANTKLTTTLMGAGSSTATTTSSSGSTSSTSGSTSTSSSGSNSTSSSIRFYANTSFWNIPIPANPSIDPNSTKIVATSILPIVSSANFDNGPIWGIALATATSSSKTYNVQCTQYCTNILTSFPIPSGAAPTTGSDHHLTVLNPSNHKELDLWDASNNNGTWSAGSVTINDYGPTGWGACGPLGSHCNSSVAAGFAGMGGVVRPEEIKAGHIDHALSITMITTKADYIACPATHTGGNSSNSYAIPLGAHIQLDPSFNVSAQPWPQWEKVIGHALQTYGAYVSDTGGSMAIYGQTDQNTGNVSWSSVGVPEGGASLANLPWSDFRVLSIQSCN